MGDERDIEKALEHQERKKRSDKKNLEYDQKRLKNQEDLVKLMKEAAGHGADITGYYEKDIDNQIKAIELKQEELRLAEGLKAEEVARFQQQIKALKAQKEGMDMAASGMKRYLGLTKESGKMFENWGSKMKGMKKEMKETATLGNLAGAGIQKIVESTIALALAQDEAKVAFNKSTGSAGKFNRSIESLQKRMNKYGVTAGEAGKTAAALFKGVTDYTLMSGEAQVALEDTASILQEMGVSLDTTASNMQFFLKVMKKGPVEAAKATRKLFSAAQEMGISVQQLSSDFESAKGLIAALGDTGEAAFIKLQAQTKATGLSFDILLRTVEKFDTFEGAATQVGKLNAILGGPFLNSLEMVAETDPAERMRKLSEGIRASGVSFEEMGYYQKKAMTAAMGLNNEMELALFLSGDLEDARGPVKTTEDFKALAEQTANFQTFMDELKQFAVELAEDMGPVLDWIKDVVHHSAEWADKIKAVIAAMVVLKGVSMAVAAAQAIAAIATAFATSGANIIAGGAALVGAGLLAGGGVMYMNSLLSSPGGGGAKAPETATNKAYQPTLHNGGPGTGQNTTVLKDELMFSNLGPDNYVAPIGSFNPYALDSAAMSRGYAGGDGGGGFSGTVVVKIGDQDISEMVNNVKITPHGGPGGSRSVANDSIMGGFSEKIMGAS